jgi:hypothetical protein
MLSSALPTVLATTLPPTIDNAYRGRTIGLWLLALVVSVKVAQIVSVLIDGPGIVAAADGIPLDTFSPEAARTVVAAFVGMGVSRLLLCVLCALVLWRYRSAVPLMFVLLALHDVARELVLGPVRSGTPVGPYVNWTLFVLTLVGVVLSVSSSAPPKARTPIG